MKELLIATFGGVALASNPVSAATSQASGSPSMAPASEPLTANGQWVFKSSHGKWGVVCNPVNATDCRAVQNLFSVDGNTQRRLLQVVLLLINGKIFIAINLPLGVDLRAGTALKIGEAEELKGSYATCLPDGCQAYFELNDSQALKIQHEKAMQIGFRPWGADKKTFILEASLDKIGDVVAALREK